MEFNLLFRLGPKKDFLKNISYMRKENRKKFSGVFFFSVKTIIYLEKLVN